ncbi:MAG: hypothetical protein VYC39_06635 [Myxococcota bacterium]|nr:hypothetical protein [Myxococcota bacterium]
MSKFQLELQEIPDEARSSIVEAGRTAGPPLNRKKFNSALMGSVPLPVVIATSQDAAAIDKLERKLTRAGAVLEIREPQETVDFASQFAGLSSTVKSLSQKEKIALAGVTTIAIIAVIMVVGFLFGQEKKPPTKVEIAVKNKLTKTASTATVSVSSEKITSPKKATPFVNFLVDLPSIKNPCSGQDKKSNCILGQLRGLSATASEIQQKALSDESYLKALHHRLFLCLAEERSRPEEGDKKAVETGLRILAPYLFAQYGAEDCTSSRSAMYECVKSARAKTCEALEEQLHLAKVQFENQPSTLPWTDTLSLSYRTTISSCLKSEQRRTLSHEEFVKLDLFRQRFAAALEQIKNTCKEEEYIECGKNLVKEPCSAIGPYLTLNPSKLVRIVTNRCELLRTCR